MVRKEYAALLMEKMRAPDGSYEEGLVIPGTGASPPKVEQLRQDLEKNNPLSLDDQVRSVCKWEGHIADDDCAEPMDRMVCEC